MIEILSLREIDFLTGICNEFHDCPSNCGEREAARRAEWEREQAAKAESTDAGTGHGDYEWRSGH
jgi:hypothetical protein